MKTIAITLGDPGGIGPEVALKALYQNRWPKNLRFILVGSRAVLRRQARQLHLPLPPAWRLNTKPSSSGAIVNWEPEQELKQQSAPLTWQPACNAMRPPATLSRSDCGLGSIAGRPGVTGKVQACAAVRWIQAAARGCQAGHFAAMVTAPISKQSLALAGLPFSGHTEYLAALTGVNRYAMMLLGGFLRVVLVTRHLPLKRVPGAISRAAIRTAVQLTAQALPWLGVKRKTIGVCALNPHAGDGGLLGREEIDCIVPALRSLRREGLRVEGPIAGDVIFHQAREGRYGAIVAMYHDQGLGPLKMIAFNEGINLTLGLPIVRTSPDHGTAFDIAGKGRAHSGSMAEAIRLAVRLTHRRNPWSGEGCSRKDLNLHLMKETWS